jgi:glyoxylase-like metal-dependent hydrolase (beta-lactamase superfamily II)
MSSIRQVSTIAVVASILAAATAVAQPPNGPPPLIKQDARVPLAAHSYTILDDNVSFVPNVGIVAGSRATLVIDTGLGERNGAIVLGEARKVSGNTQFYIAATHFHPEHDLGATAFPANATVLRWIAQQQDADELGAEMNRRFASFAPAVAELLKGARFRAADIVFEDGVTLDLGGVHVRVWGVGPTHTRGDTVFFVVEDRVLYAGDVVMPVFPAVSGQSGSIAKWLADMDEFEALNPAVVVPAHGRTGDIGMIRRMREYLRAVQSEVAAAKRGGASVEQAIERLAAPLAARFPDLAPANGPATGRVNAAIQAAYREAP